MLAKKLGLEWQSVRRLVDVQKQSNTTLPELAQAVQQLLHKEPYTREEVAKELGISVSLKIQLLAGISTEIIGIPNLHPPDLGSHFREDFHNSSYYPFRSK
jgi:hypothetical protein